MYKVVNFEEKYEWNKVVSLFDNNDIYFKNEYFQAFKINNEGIPRLFYFENENGKVAIPFMLRDIANDNKFKEKLEYNRFFDISTVYGYGGPLYEVNTSENQLLVDFSKVFSDYCRENNIISEFIRFDPILDNHRFYKNYCEVIHSRNTINIKINKDIDIMWKNLSRENRNRVRRAEKNSIGIVSGRDENLLESFIEIYYQTMVRDSADSYYFFKKEFFESCIRDLDENSIIFAAKYNEQIISAGIVIYNDKYAHYHFGGSKKEYMSLAPNNLLLFEVMKWCAKMGIKSFHLGGGSRIVAMSFCEPRSW